MLGIDPIAYWEPIARIAFHLNVRRMLESAKMLATSPVGSGGAVIRCLRLQLPADCRTIFGVRNRHQVSAVVPAESENASVTQPRV